MDNNDIKKLLCKIKNNIEIVECGKYSEKNLEEIEEDKKFWIIKMKYSQGVSPKKGE